MSSKSISVRRLILAAMFLALAMVLPFLTGQIPQIGRALSPMHIPALLCGFFCGPWYGLAVGFIAPLLRFALFGMPPILPKGLAMCFELATYGCVSGLMYRILPKKKINVYVALITAMIAGRIIWGIASAIIYGFGDSEFGWSAFIAGGIVGSAPGIILQIILIPVLVITLEKYTANSGN